MAYPKWRKTSKNRHIFNQEGKRHFIYVRIILFKGEKKILCERHILYLVIEPGLPVFKLINLVPRAFVFLGQHRRQTFDSGITEFLLRISVFNSGFHCA